MTGTRNSNSVKAVALLKFTSTSSGSENLHTTSARPDWSNLTRNQYKLQSDSAVLASLLASHLGVTQADVIVDRVE